MSLDDLDDSCSTKDGQSKKSRFTKRLHSPDRSVWDTSLFFPGGGSKNEIEKMFEKFKIKMAEDDENGVHPETDVASRVRDVVTDSDFSPGHSEYSKLIGDINKAYTSSVDDVKHPVTVRDCNQGDEKNGKKKKKKHKKDKHDKEKKTRRSKSSSKDGAEPDSAVVVPVGTQSFRQLTTQQSDDGVFVTASRQISGGNVRSLSTTHTAESAGLELPAVHASCHMTVVLSETPGESNIDEIGSVDINPLDCSAAELIPPTPTREVCSADLTFIQFLFSHTSCIKILFSLCLSFFV